LAANKRLYATSWIFRHIFSDSPSNIDVTPSLEYREVDLREESSSFSSMVSVSVTDESTAEETWKTMK
jgi:hypothetical protein